MWPWKFALNHSCSRASAFARSILLTPICWKPSSSAQSRISDFSRSGSSILCRRSVITASIIVPMRSLPVEIYSVATVREIDRTAIEDEGIPGYTLMTRAGAAAVRAARERFPDASRWQVVCGAGNNAGDGYVVARLAAQEGVVVSVVALVDPESLTGDAATAYGDFAAEGGVVMPWESALDDEADLLVDALLGSGLERDVSGEFA